MLDLAGGSGWPALPLAKAFPNAQIICTGTSPMRAQRRVMCPSPLIRALARSLWHTHGPLPLQHCCMHACGPPTGGSQRTAASASGQIAEQCRAATDLSPRMVEFAALRVEAAGLSGRVVTKQADAQDLSAWQVRPANLSATTSPLGTAATQRLRCSGFSAVFGTTSCPEADPPICMIAPQAVLGSDPQCSCCAILSRDCRHAVSRTPASTRSPVSTACSSRRTSRRR